MNKQKIYTALLPLMLLVALAGCSSSDDDYQAAEPLQSDNQQVHFSDENADTKLLDPADPSSYKFDLKVVRNTTHGKLTVPVEIDPSTTAGVDIADSVVFADGDSVATLAVSIPDTATTSGDSYSYSLKLVSDQTDPYSYLGGGITFSGTATVPATVKLQCWISGVLSTKWEETALDLSGGHYRISNFMNSGYALDLTITDGKLQVSVPSNSPLYTENSDYGTYIYWFTDDYIHLYPYGKEGGVDINDFVIINSSTYNSYLAQSKYGWFMLSEIQTTTMDEPTYWAYFCFQFE